MNEFTHFHADGSVDVYTSKEAFGEALEKWAKERETIEGDVREAVDSVLKVSGETRVALSKLVNMVLCKLQPSLSEYDEKQAFVEVFIKRNTTSKEKPKDSALYEAQKGKGGGYRLVGAEKKDTIPAPACDQDSEESD